MKKFRSVILPGLFLLLPAVSAAQPAIYVNQVALDAAGPKMAVIRLDSPAPSKPTFSLISLTGNKTVLTAPCEQATTIGDWAPGKYYYRANFSAFTKTGKYVVSTTSGGKEYRSEPFEISAHALAVRTVPAIISYYTHQRADTPAELSADAKVLLYGSNETADMRGGWCDASGDVSKYFSHLAYANFMSPQQTPLVVWSMLSANDALPRLLPGAVKDSLRQEAIWGADYMMRALSDSGYFRMIIFSYFKKDPSARRVVGLKANSITTNEYQSAFREGGGLAIAALARISMLGKDGDFTSAAYLEAAKKAFDHLLINNTRYTDDGKENIIDDYCALLGATELWIATNDPRYRTEARKRAANLEKRLSPQGYFIADDGNRPFWHASDAGLPVVALSRYLTKETDPAYTAPALATIKAALDYNLRVTSETNNPFGYARQTFRYKGNIQNGFFIPHENETGWWWQGENARLGSLAAAAIIGGRLVYPAKGGWGVKPELAEFAANQLSWILGRNPYSMCFLYQFGKNNVPYMSSNYGHGSGKGGISNGITGKDGNADGSGIDFKISANGNEWRWTEQWIPHAAWFLQAVAAMAEER
ncbi:glycoside hydrolase family 9 protein [Hufsiella ginkgonis]|uniref:Glycosyl transferase n=1 Tax=Hufsiella ginkgonis TaxID=2695274 RepID=A0A7K1Y074_9SPHI|nr:glycoside hydrolase family 9 protein [Hufsiella ginkgonis]MXV16458.1 glycosyl transferase [Hufsiella ginkgonis]